MVGGKKLPLVQRLPPVRGYMDDITTILQTAACTRLLKRIEELVDSRLTQQTSLIGRWGEQ